LKGGDYYVVDGWPEGKNWWEFRWKAQELLKKVLERLHPK